MVVNLIKLLCDSLLVRWIFRRVHPVLIDSHSERLQYQSAHLLDSGRRLSYLAIEQLCSDPFEEGTTHLILLSKASQPVCFNLCLQLFHNDFAQKHVVNLLFELLVSAAAEDEVDHEQEVLVAILEDIIKLGGKFAHSGLIQD